MPADTVETASGRLDLSCRGRFQICAAYFEGVSSYFVSDQHEEEWRTKLVGVITATRQARFP